MEKKKKAQTCNAMAICTNHSTTCRSSSSTPFCSFSFVYRSPPSQYCMAMYSIPSGVSNDCLYDTILGCFSFCRSFASCSAEVRSLLEARWRLIRFNTYWKQIAMHAFLQKLKGVGIGEEEGRSERDDDFTISSSSF